MARRIVIALVSDKKDPTLLIPWHADLVLREFDLSPRGMLDTLDLRRPVYLPTARHGHFGRSGPGYTWEVSDRAPALRDGVGETVA